MAPRLKLLVASVSKKGTKIYFFFSLRIPGEQTPSWFPNRADMERDTRLQGILYTCHKNSSNKKAPRKKRPSMFPKGGAPTEKDAHFWALLNISSGSQ